MANLNRVVLIGNAFVGKTALIQKYMNKTIDEKYEETVGAAFHSYQITLNNVTSTIQVWDTAGQEKYKSLSPVYYRNASVAIAVYDATDRKSFTDLPGWIENFKNTSGDSANIVVVGNKIDLDGNIQVDVAEGQKFANDYGYDFFSTSAKTGLNVEFLFQKVAQLAIQQSTAVPKKINNEITTTNQSNGCCN